MVMIIVSATIINKENMDNTMYTGLNSFPGSEFRGGKERLNIQVETQGDQNDFF